MCKAQCFLRKYKPWIWLRNLSSFKLRNDNYEIKFDQNRTCFYVRIIYSSSAEFPRFQSFRVLGQGGPGLGCRLCHSIGMTQSIALASLKLKVSFECTTSFYFKLTKMKLFKYASARIICLFQSTTQLYWKLWQVFQDVKIISSCNSEVPMVCKLSFENVLEHS